MVHKSPPLFKMGGMTLSHCYFIENPCDSLKVFVKQWGRMGFCIPREDLGQGGDSSFSPRHTSPMHCPLGAN